MRVTCLVENLKNELKPELGNEHGLSLFIELEGLKILFDTGASSLFTDNAQKLGIDLSEVDIAILSHGHYDHAGGIGAFMEVNNRATLFISRQADEKHFFKSFFLPKRDIGIDKAVINKFLDRIKFINTETEVTPGVYILPINVHDHALPAGNRYLYTVQNGKMVKDDFHHELLMVIKDEKGISLFTGCSHNGILNMIDTALQKFPDSPITAIFGGFHMIGLPFFNHMPEKKANIKQIGEKLLERPLGKVYSGHCTGKKAYPILKDVMGDKLDYFRPGSVIEV